VKRIAEQQSSESINIVRVYSRMDILQVHVYQLYCQIFSLYKCNSLLYHVCINIFYLLVYVQYLEALCLQQSRVHDRILMSVIVFFSSMYIHVTT